MKPGNEACFCRTEYINYTLNMYILPKGTYLISVLYGFVSNESLCPHFHGSVMVYLSTEMAAKTCGCRVPNYWNVI